MHPFLSLLWQYRPFILHKLFQVKMREKFKFFILFFLNSSLITSPFNGFSLFLFLPRNLLVYYLRFPIWLIHFQSLFLGECHKHIYPASNTFHFLQYLHLNIANHNPRFSVWYHKAVPHHLSNINLCSNSIYLFLLCQQNQWELPINLWYLHCDHHK